jgi:hypothetical protein
MSSDRYGPAEMFSLQTCFGYACPNSLPEDFVFKGREHREQPGHGAARRRGQIECFRERHESDAQFCQFLKGDDQVDQ